MWTLLANKTTFHNLINIIRLSVITFFIAHIVINMLLKIFFNVFYRGQWVTIIYYFLR